MIDRYARPEMQRVWSDSGKFDRWLEVEIAVCEAWTAEGTIPPEDMQKIRHSTWNSTLFQEKLTETRHDMTAFLYSVTSGLGPEGRWIHLGLTSNDVWDTATALQSRDAGNILLKECDDLIEVLRGRAVEFKNTITMGRTHGIHAEPTTFGLRLAVWWDEMRRHRGRLERCIAEISVGMFSGVVGTHATVPIQIEEKACQYLGISPAPLTTQIVQRDRHANFLSTIALIAASLEKFATEIRSLQRTEIHEVEEPFGEGQTGSSAMPHKRNPELSERVCGLARVIRGYSLTGLENVALWHERDISHSSAERVILPDATMAMDYILDLLTGVIRGLKVFPKKMIGNIELTRGLIFSQRILLMLIHKGMPREDAYHLVQEHSKTTWEEGPDFRELLRKDRRITGLLVPDELESAFSFDYYTRHIAELFERAGLS